jgi:uncharacterized membrane protein YhaH (DUF805 family)
MEWMLMPLRKFAQFGGRSRRTEYWMFFVFNILVGVVTNLVDRLLGLGAVGIDTFATLALLIPNAALWVRRLHDVNRSGWWIWTIITPAGLILQQAWGRENEPVTNGIMVLAGLLVVAAIWNLVLMLLPGTKGPNNFGPDPKNPDGDLQSVFS